MDKTKSAQTKKEYILTYIPPENLPLHDESDRFQEYCGIIVGTKKGFEIPDGTQFFFENDGGWVDEGGCYYNKDGEPDGWKVKCDDGQVHFYDLNGCYVPSDEGDLEELPKHNKGNWKVQNKFAINNKNEKFEIDRYNGWEDYEGCYYEDSEPAGWIIKKADGNLYLFDMEGHYVCREEDEHLNDLLDYDLDMVPKISQNNKTNNPPASLTQQSKEQQPRQAQQQNQKDQQPRQQPKQQQQEEPKKQQSYGSPTQFRFVLVDSKDVTVDIQILLAFLKGKAQKDIVETMALSSKLIVKCSCDPVSLNYRQGDVLEYSQGKKAKLEEKKQIK